MRVSTALKATPGTCSAVPSKSTMSPFSVPFCVTVRLDRCGLRKRERLSTRGRGAARCDPCQCRRRRHLDEHFLDGVLSPGVCDVIAMRHALRGLDEYHAAGPQRPVHIISDGNVLFFQHLDQFAIVPLGVTRICADEKAGPVVLDPGCELVQLTVDRVEQEHAAYPIAEAADFKAPGRRHKAAAVADDDDRHVCKSPGGAGIAV